MIFTTAIKTKNKNAMIKEKMAKRASEDIHTKGEIKFILS